MSSTSQIREDNSRLSQLDQVLFRIEKVFTLAAGSVVLLLMLLSVVQILGRKFFNLPVPGFIDWVEQLMPIFAFLGIAYCQRLGGHIRMDIVVGQLKGRPLWFAEALSCFLMLLVVSILIYGTYLHFERAWVNGDSSVDLHLPTWPAKLIVPIAFSVLWLRLILQFWGYCRAFLENAVTPVAVPLIEDAAQQAKREAESL